MKSRLRKYFFLSARLLLGALFIAASIDKIAHPGEFSGQRVEPDRHVEDAAHQIDMRAAASLGRAVREQAERQGEAARPQAK